MRSRMLLVCFVFVSTMFFFTVVHPVTIISGDDWANLSLSRSVFPSWGGFNPTKVVPEILMPFAGLFASYVIMPLGITYLFSIALVTAFLVSSLLSVMLSELHLLIHKKMGVNEEKTSLVLLFYYMCIFALFKTQPGSASPYLLWEINLTCYYHYVIPALLNSALVIYLMRSDVSMEAINRRSDVNFGFLILAAYLCIFSNVFSSVFLMVFCCIKIANAIFCRKHFSYREFVENTVRNVFYIGVVIVWAISAVFEINGGRASQIEQSGILFHESIAQFWLLLKLSDMKIVSLLTVGLLFGVFFSFKGYKNKPNSFKSIYWLCVFSCAATFIMLMMICGKASPGYASRPVVVWGVYMYFMLAAIVSAACALERYRFVNAIFPVLCVFLLNKAITPGLSLRESHNLNLSYSKASEVTNNIIMQVIDAEKNGTQELALQVPKGDSNDNWPFPVYMGPSISKTLKTDGLINKEIKINIKPNLDMNKEFDL